MGIAKFALRRAVLVPIQRGSAETVLTIVALAYVQLGLSRRRTFELSSFFGRRVQSLFSITIHKMQQHADYHLPFSERMLKSNFRKSSRLQSQSGLGLRCLPRLVDVKLNSALTTSLR